MKKKSVYQELYDTRFDHAKLIENPIEAGDLVNETGKSYMKGLWKAIEEHKCYKRFALWFMVVVKKDMKSDRMIRISIAAIDKPLEFYHEGVDLWKYDYFCDKLELVWSLPHRTEMKNFLKNPEKYDKNIVKWIREYIKQDKINLKDKSGVKL